MTWQTDEIKKAHDLLQIGAITQDEFENIKSVVLESGTSSDPDSPDARQSIDHGRVSDPASKTPSNSEVLAQVGTGCGKTIGIVVLSIVVVNLFMCALLRAWAG